MINKKWIDTWTDVYHFLGCKPLVLCLSPRDVKTHVELTENDPYWDKYHIIHNLNKFIQTLCWIEKDYKYKINCYAGVNPPTWPCQPRSPSHARSTISQLRNIMLDIDAPRHTPPKYVSLILKQMFSFFGTITSTWKIIRTSLSGRHIIIPLAPIEIATQKKYDSVMKSLSEFVWCITNENYWHKIVNEHSCVVKPDIAACGAKTMLRIPKTWNTNKNYRAQSLSKDWNRIENEETWKIIKKVKK